MNIAICDDKKEVAELFSHKVQMEDAESEISIFTNGTDLIESGLKFDVVFLDIEMETMDGFSVAEILNKQQPKCVFSFITTHADLAVDGYDYQPFRYILKTAPEPVIKRKIKETLHEYYCRNKTLKISYKGKHCMVLVSDILWIEIKGHCMRVVLENGEVLWNKTLNEAEKELENYGLARCHRSFIVAMGKIETIKANRIKMKTGQDIPIGRKYKKHVDEIYNNFILN